MDKEKEIEKILNMTKEEAFEETVDKFLNGDKERFLTAVEMSIHSTLAALEVKNINELIDFLEHWKKSLEQIKEKANKIN